MTDNRPISNAAFSRRNSIALSVAILTILVLSIYGQITNFDFLNYDDTTFTTQNYLVQKGLTWEGIRKIFTNPDYFCMQTSFLSHMLDCHFFGLDAGKHHLSNLLLHLFNALLLFHVLNRMTGTLWRSTVVSVLFAIHPLNVESVAWIAERRNVLSTFFWFLTLLAYWRYAQRPKFLNYMYVIVLFVLGLMAKSMLVTLPFLLLLLDYWPLKRIELKVQSSKSKANASEYESFPQNSPLRLIKEKIPLMTISVIACYLTLISAQNKGGIKGIGGLVSFEAIPLGVRIANAAMVYIKYIIKIFWPFQLSVYYAYPYSLSIWQVIGAVLLILTMFITSWKYLRTLPFLAVGWFWYMGTLVPVIGIVQLGGQAMADRYIYVPIIGIFIILVWTAAAWWSRTGMNWKVLTGFATVCCISLSMNAWTQVRHWQNSLTLFEYTVRMTPNYAVAHNNLGMALAADGRLEEAIENIAKAINLHPAFAEAYNNLGNVLSTKGEMDKAVENYEKALQLNPNYAEAHNNMGIAYFSLKMPDKAVFHFNQALRISPDYPDARHNLKVVQKR